MLLSHDESPISSVLAETTGILASGSYGYQIMVVVVIRLDAAINTKLSERPAQYNQQLYLNEMVKPDIGHKEPIIIGLLSIRTLNWDCCSSVATFLQNFAKQ